MKLLEAIKDEKGAREERTDQTEMISLVPGQSSFRFPSRRARRKNLSRVAQPASTSFRPDLASSKPN
jgi:hypothetical protein